MREQSCVRNDESHVNLDDNDPNKEPAMMAMTAPVCSWHHAVVFGAFCGVLKSLDALFVPKTRRVPTKRSNRAHRHSHKKNTQQITENYLQFDKANAIVSLVLTKQLP